MRVDDGDVLADLREGNRRFAEGRARGPRRDAERRRGVSRAQAPRAIVLTCSDSRVPPEILFDQGLGDLFVVRSAGHVVDRAILGSLEYAVGHLRPKLLLVLGHSRCGAVASAVSGETAHGAVGWVVAEVRPAVSASGLVDGDRVENAAREHARRTADRLPRVSDALREAVERGELLLVAGFYDLDSGRVEIL